MTMIIQKGRGKIYDYENKHDEENEIVKHWARMIRKTETGKINLHKNWETQVKLVQMLLWAQQRTQCIRQQPKKKSQKNIDNNSSMNNKNIVHEMAIKSTSVKFEKNNFIFYYGHRASKFHSIE